MSRAYESYTLADVHRLKGGFMKRTVDKDKLPVVLDRVRYLKEIARSNPRLLNAPFIDTFMESQDTPVIDIPELNKRAFEYLEAFKTDDTDAIEMLESIKDEFTKNYVGDATADHERRLADVERYIRSTSAKIDSIMEDLFSYNNTLSGYFKERDDLEEKIESAKTEVDADHWMIDQVRAIVADGKWKFYKYGRGNFYFVSKNRIELRNYNPAAGIDKSLDMGHFAITIDHKGSIKCYGSEGSITASSSSWSDCSHPHVNGGSICWGNVGSRVTDNINRRDILSNVRLLDQLLVTYSADNPYVKFTTFQRSQANRKTEDDQDTRRALGLPTNEDLVIEKFLAENEGMKVSFYASAKHVSEGDRVLIVSTKKKGGPREQIGLLATVGEIFGSYFKVSFDAPIPRDGQVVQTRDLVEVVKVEENKDEE